MKKIAALGKPGVLAMARGLTDGDAHAALPALEVALSDSDADTRGFAAQAITAIKKVP